MHRLPVQPTWVQWVAGLPDGSDAMSLDYDHDHYDHHDHNNYDQYHYDHARSRPVLVLDADSR